MLTFMKSCVTSEQNPQTARGLQSVGCQVTTSVNITHQSAPTATRVVLTLLMLHGTLLMWAAYRDSPTWDEVAHFAAGLDHWHEGSFKLYRVNPPLVRLVACAPIATMGAPPAVRSEALGPVIDSRPEFEQGRRLAQALGPKYFWLMTLARWAC